jgi:hypothetical protein
MDDVRMEGREVRPQIKGRSETPALILRSPGKDQAAVGQGRVLRRGEERQAPEAGWGQGRAGHRCAAPTSVLSLRPSSNWGSCAWCRSASRRGTDHQLRCTLRPAGARSGEQLGLAGASNFH